MKRRKHTRRAFSLLELTLVLLLIGILGSVAAVSMFGRAEKAKIQATEMSMEVIGGAISTYILENNMAPAGIQSLVTEGYIQSGKTKDAWGQQFVYRVTPDGLNEFELISLGKDPNNPQDDINYWLLNE